MSYYKIGCYGINLKGKTIEFCKSNFREDYSNMITQIRIDFYGTYYEKLSSVCAHTCRTLQGSTMGLLGQKTWDSVSYSDSGLLLM